MFQEIQTFYYGKVSVNNMSYILGLNSVYHESSVCLVQDGEIVAYAEEERLNRVKHAKFSRPDNADELPLQSIDYCLNVVGITGRDITQIGFSFSPEKRLNNLGADPYPISGVGYGTEIGEYQLQEKLEATPSLIRDYLGNPDLPFIWLDHHLCHAASAVLISPYRQSAFLVIDGIGEFETATLGYADGGQFNIYRTIDYPNSVGFLWEKMAMFLGFTKYDAGKIMGLGGYGQSNQTYDQFRQFIDISGGSFLIDNQVLKIRADDESGLEAVFGVAKRQPDEPITETHANIVAGLQHVTEMIILHLAEDLAQTTECNNLCMAGGVALNCQANTRLATTGLFENIFIPPHCNDAGTSIGAALYLSSQTGHARTNLDKPFIPYWRTEPSEEEVLLALQGTPFVHQKMDDINQTAAKLLADGEIIAYYQGASEIGPRALGNRSILASPMNFMIKERLNFHFKQREFFRPLAPVVLREHIDEYFEMPINFTPSLYYMLFVLKVKPDKQDLVPGITHIDGTARLQVVDKQINPRLYNLMQHYYHLTGIPILLNTSFNKQEPIVHTPGEALHTFGRIARLDHLMLNDWWVQKKSTPATTMGTQPDVE